MATVDLTVHTCSGGNRAGLGRLRSPEVGRSCLVEAPQGAGPRGCIGHHRGSTQGPLGRRGLVATGRLRTLYPAAGRLEEWECWRVAAAAAASVVLCSASMRVLVLLMSGSEKG